MGPGFLHGTCPWAEGPRDSESRRWQFFISVRCLPSLAAYSAAIGASGARHDRAGKLADGAPLIRLGRQVCLKKREHGRIELFVEGSAVETRRIGAELGPGARQNGRTRRQEPEVSRIRHHMIFVLRWQVRVDRGNAFGCYSVAAALRRPQLNRYFDSRKAIPVALGG